MNQERTRSSVASDGTGTSASLDRYRQIYEGVALPVLMIDAETWCIVAVNQAAVAQYGYTREEFVGLPALEIRPPEGKAEARKVLIEMPHGFWKASAVLHCRKDGSVLVVDVWSQDTVVDGRPVRIATVSDVTERIQLQHELQQAQKMEAVGRLAGGIAHDFNNALTSIMVNAELLRATFGDDPAWDVELTDILRYAERAAQLTGQLLAFSRKQLVSAEVVPLNDVVLRAEALMRPAIDGRIDVETRLAVDAGSVRVGPTQLAQAILNLALNAQDAMPDGGTLVVATRNVSLVRDATVDGVTIPSGDYVEFTMRDTGIGMDELTRARVFEPFFTTKPPPHGTGLGLSVAYGIVRQSAGYLTVDSAVGEGATFRILLPRVGHAAPAVAAEGAPAGDRARQTVLVVDDEDGVRHVTSRVLERLGYAVLAAASGEEALAMVERSRPALDLLVTDVVMGRIGGPELAGKLAEAYPGLRVLYVSGYANDAVGHGGTLGGKNGFLQKPFSVESLGQAVREVLGRE